jgi:hypothetical protein
MTKIIEAPAGTGKKSGTQSAVLRSKTTEEAKTPDGTLVTQTDSQTFVMDVFFNHDSKETFQDKLLKVILAETGGFIHANK